MVVYMTHLHYVVLPHPTSGIDLALSDFNLVGFMKTAFRGGEFANYSVVKEVVHL
jgi:hypothetical protein